MVGRHQAEGLVTLKTKHLLITNGLETQVKQVKYESGFFLQQFSALIVRLTGSHPKRSPPLIIVEGCLKCYGRRGLSGAMPLVHPVRNTLRYSRRVVSPFMARLRMVLHQASRLICEPLPHGCSRVRPPLSQGADPVMLLVGG